MAKTYSVQIEKAQSLLKGIRMNYDKVSTLGITQTELRNLEHVTVEVDRINKELDSMRAAVSKKAVDGSNRLIELRVQIQSLKHIVKKSFEQHEWSSFGISDKR